MNISPPKEIRQSNLHYTGQCTICDILGYTEFHHIITPSQAPEHHHNPDNMIELCLECHNRTTASIVYRYINNLPPDDRCYRCGHHGHFEDDCYARYDAHGFQLSHLH